MGLFPDAFQTPNTMYAPHKFQNGVYASSNIVYPPLNSVWTQHASSCQSWRFRSVPPQNSLTGQWPPHTRMSSTPHLGWNSPGNASSKIMHPGEFHPLCTCLYKRTVFVACACQVLNVLLFQIERCIQWIWYFLSDFLQLALYLVPYLPVCVPLHHHRYNIIRKHTHLLWPFLVITSQFCTGWHGKRLDCCIMCNSIGSLVVWFIKKRQKFDSVCVSNILKPKLFCLITSLWGNLIWGLF